MKVSFVGKVGNDIFGNFCKDQLREKGVDTSFLVQCEDVKTGATVILNFGDDRAMVTHQGAMLHLGISDITSEMLSGARHLHFSSYYLQPGFKDKLDVLFQRAKHAGLTTSLDMQWDPAEKWDFDFKKVLPYVDIFLPNESELLYLTRRNTIDTALQTINGYGNITVVKQGNRGSLLYADRKLVSRKPFLNENVVDAIGAGDSFNAGFIFSNFAHAKNISKRAANARIPYSKINALC